MKVLTSFLLISLLFLTGTAWARDITLAWNGSQDATGYELYTGSEPGVYDDPVDVGDVTTYTMTNLGPSVRYFALKAYNSFGKSLFSEEAIALDAPEWQMILISN